MAARTKPTPPPLPVTEAAQQDHLLRVHETDWQALTEIAYRERRTRKAQFTVIIADYEARHRG